LERRPASLQLADVGRNLLRKVTQFGDIEFADRLEGGARDLGDATECPECLDQCRGVLRGDAGDLEVVGLGEAGQSIEERLRCLGDLGQAGK
jgi:hypothetical protein